MQLQQLQHDATTSRGFITSNWCFTFKAYVNGYESQRLGTTFVDVDKARDFDTANNNKTRFTIR